MSKRNLHVGKSSYQKSAYQKYIQRMDLEPTLDDTVNFGDSAKGGEELSEPTSKRKRRIKAKDKLANHISDNWVIWLSGFFAAALVYFLVDSKIDFAKLGTNFNNQIEKIAKIRETSVLNEKQNHTQDIQINENKLRIEFIEKDNLKKVKTDE